MTPDASTPAEKIVPQNPQSLSVGLRLLVILFLVAVLMIPALLINFLVQERKTRKAGTVAEIANQWSGGSQVVTAPILSLPYKQYFKDEKGNIQFNIQYAHFLPGTLKISGTMTPEVRYRGIYKIILYRAQLHVNGDFAFPDLRSLNLKPENVLWDSAFVSLGLANTKGLENKVSLRWNQAELPALPGLPSHDVGASGIHVPVPLQASTGTYAFAFDLNQKGHESLMFAPLGRETRVHLEAPWGAPSFIGEFLPDQRDVRPDRFSADWKVLDLNRNIPQQWLGENQGLAASAFGVNLFVPVDQYQQTSRTLKYSIMFLGLTFLALFMIDVMGNANRKPLHFIQYLLIGVALVVYYVLLLSLSEHIGFAWAYLAASAAVIGLILLYTKSILASLRQTGLVALMLTVLYAYLYIILQLEDYALLIGSVSLFLILGLVMYLTRKLDWASLGQAGVKQ